MDVAKQGMALAMKLKGGVNALLFYMTMFLLTTVRLEHITLQRRSFNLEV